MMLGLRVGLLAGFALVACGPGTAAPDDDSVGETEDETETEDPPDGTTTGMEGETDPPEPQCVSPLLVCGDLCVDPRFDPMHCGGCDVACEDGEFCVDGSCSLVCGPGTELCDSECVDLEVDPLHCGECGHVCPEGAACLDSQCVLDCPEGEIQCGETCVDTSNDELHCGDCDTACAEQAHCVFSSCVEASLHHVLITGQSLSVGQQSAVVTISQPFSNVSFAGGVRVDDDDTSSLIPLRETQDGIFGETIASGMANLLTWLTTTETFGGIRLLVSAHGVSSASYLELARGTAPYVRGMAHAGAATSLATDLAETHLVRAIVAIHGERDHVLGNQFYDDDLIAWQADYQQDIQAITGQDVDVPLFICQMSSWTHYDAATSLIPVAQFEASRRAPNRVVLVGPKYFLPYVDGLHLTGSGERELGEYYAKAMRSQLVDGKPWIPLSPREVSRIGRTIDVDFHVPAPPLVLDTMEVSDPGNYGFEYTDASETPPSIESVQLTGDTTVRITLTEEPTSGGRRLRYAYTATPGVPSGATTGARGNLRDSDDTQSLQGYSLYNWAVHFDEAVP